MIWPTIYIPPYLTLHKSLRISDFTLFFSAALKGVLDSNLSIFFLSLCCKCLTKYRGLLLGSICFKPSTPTFVMSFVIPWSLISKTNCEDVVISLIKWKNRGLKNGMLCSICSYKSLITLADTFDPKIT